MKKLLLGIVVISIWSSILSSPVEPTPDQKIKECMDSDPVAWVMQLFPNGYLSAYTYCMSIRGSSHTYPVS